MYYGLKKKVWHRLGNMCPDRDEMKVIYSLPESTVRWFSAWYEGRFVGSLYCYRTPSLYTLKGTILNYDFPKLNINLRLYVESIRSACEEGMKYYDFGSTPPPGSSHYAWKLTFNGSPRPIDYFEKVLDPLRVLVRKSLIRGSNLLGKECTYKYKTLNPLVRWLEE